MLNPVGKPTDSSKDNPDNLPNRPVTQKLDIFSHLTVDGALTFYTGRRTERNSIPHDTITSRTGDLFRERRHRGEYRNHRAALEHYR
jgi:hypothetical protein